MIALKNYKCLITNVFTDVQKNTSQEKTKCLWGDRDKKSNTSCENWRKIGNWTNNVRCHLLCLKYTVPWTTMLATLPLNVKTKHWHQHHFGKKNIYKCTLGVKLAVLYQPIHSPWKNRKFYYFIEFHLYSVKRIFKGQAKKPTDCLTFIFIFKRVI